VREREKTSEPIDPEEESVTELPERDAMSIVTGPTVPVDGPLPIGPTDGSAPDPIKIIPDPKIGA
jgi:hypothetical protein